MEEPANPTRSVDGPSVRASANGPLVVTGDVPLYRRRAVHSEHGEPLAWETTERVETATRYALCRCGASERKPFCDGTHGRVGFEAADDAAGTYDTRAKVLGGSGITVRDDRSICVHAGFCGTRIANVWGQVAATEESTVRAQIISMIEHCPSGALTYRFDGRDADTEDLLPRAISVIDDGPLWVTGGIEVSTDNGPIEARNRVTLCRCGSSGNKPLCDGSHKEAGFRDASPA
ncbi:MAG: CDGSH iron-sulfur domain-containing protein [Acidimicrobiia bacterium]